MRTTIDVNINILVHDNGWRLGSHDELWSRLYGSNSEDCGRLQQAN
jgi:hypothetical protein